MGLRFRRSKKIGPLRINLSGSGVGWSIGGKVFRYTQPAKGKAYTTTTIPGTGISSRNTVKSSTLNGQPIRSAPVSQFDAPTPNPEKRKGGGILIPLLIGVLVSFLIIFGVQFATSLSGYTRENIIPPPPDRSVQMAAAETEAAVIAAPEPPETTVTLSAPEAEDLPETVPENTTPETEAPAEVIPLEPESPAETTLDEWFALVDARTHRSTYGDEEEETTLEEWFAKTEAEAGDQVRWYTVNTSTLVIHDSDNCHNAKLIKPENRSYTDDPYSLIAEGYTWCGTCHKVP